MLKNHSNYVPICVSGQRARQNCVRHSVESSCTTTKSETEKSPDAGTMWHLIFRRPDLVIFARKEAGCCMLLVLLIRARQRQLDSFHWGVCVFVVSSSCQWARRSLKNCEPLLNMLGLQQIAALSSSKGGRRCITTTAHRHLPTPLHNPKTLKPSPTPYLVRGNTS